MALPQAQLGSMPSISLGGYIPAARNDPSVLEQALMAFLGGAAGTAGNRLVDKALPDPQRVASEKLARDKMTMEKDYNDSRLGLDRDRNTIAREELTATTANRTADRDANVKDRAADRGQREADEARRTMMAMQARLGDAGLAQSQAEAAEATRQEVLRLRAAEEERTALARKADADARAPLTAAQANYYNAQAEAIKNPFGTPQNASERAGVALGMTREPQPETNLDLEELAKIQQEGQRQPGFTEQAANLTAPVAKQTMEWMQNSPMVDNLKVGAEKVADYYSFLPRKIYETFIAPALQPSNLVKPVETSTRPSYEEQRAIMEQERLRNKMLLDQMRSRGLTELNG